MNRSGHWLRLLVVPFILCLTLSACGGAGGGSSSSRVSDVRPGSEVQPLGEKASITIAVPAKLELFAQPYLAQHFGEFDNENLAVQIVTLAPADALTQLASRQIDACICAFNPGIFNAIHSGVDVRAVAGTFSKLQDSVGVYVRPDLAAEQPNDLKGKKLAISSGYASAVVTDITRWLHPAGMSLSDIEPLNVPMTDAFTALNSGGAAAAYLVEPYSTMAADRGVGVFAPGSDAQSLGTAFFFGKRLLEDDPQVGAAFLRAIVRTTRTYLQGSYHSNQKVVDAMASEFNVDSETLRSVGEVEFDPNLTTRSWPARSEDVQKIWISLGGDILDYQTPVKPETIIDTTLLDKVVEN